MFKDIQKGLAAFFTKEKVLVIFIFVLLSWVLYSYAGIKSYNTKEYLTTLEPSPLYAPVASAPVASAPSVAQSHASVSAQGTVQPSDLLPTDKNTEWAALNPNSLSQGNVLMPDLLQAGYHIGLDTIGQTLRNPNYQLRSDPVIPKQSVGPWNQSTIEPDLARVPLELGGSV